MCPIKLIDLFHSYVSEHLSTCTHGVSEFIDCIFVNVEFPRYNPLVFLTAEMNVILCRAERRNSNISSEDSM